MAYVLFQMWEPARQLQIERHQFYLRQANIRLLSQFNSLEAEADKAAEDWLSCASKNFDPDRDDDGSFYETANDKGIEFYQLLQEMRDNTRLSVVAGMYHEWDKQLREWTKSEILHWHRGEEVLAKIWSQDLTGLVDLFAGMGWDIRSKSYWKQLDACRLVVNVYKHGDGTSFKDLKQRFPEYVENPFPALQSLADTSFTDYTNLKVNEEQIEAFSQAITAFWRDVPANIYDDAAGDFPKWFEKAWHKDAGLKAR